MARPASGKEVLGIAKEFLKRARSAEELRRAQAVILPLEFGFSMQQVAEVIGVSPGWACHLRTQFIHSGGVRPESKPKHGGRRRENMSRAEEEIFLAPFLEKAAAGGILMIREIKQALDQHLGRKTALASVYNLLHRHNWRKLAPDKRHPKSDAIAQQEDWKNNSRKRTK